MGWFMWFLTMFITFWLYRWAFAIIKEEEGSEFEFPLSLLITAILVFFVPYVNVIGCIVVGFCYLKSIDYFSKDVGGFVRKVFFLKDKE